MKPRWTHQRNQALTLVEVIVIVAVLMFLGVCLLSVLSAAHKQSKEINCVNNLHEIGAAHRRWEVDGNRHSSLQISASDQDVWVLWQSMSNWLRTPKILVCPADRKRAVAASFATGFGNANISYFLNGAAKTDPQTVLDGDANLTVDGVPVQPGVLNVWTNNRVGWTKERNHGGGGWGNIGMADGSVGTTTPDSVNSAFAASPITNRLAIP